MTRSILDVSKMEMLDTKNINITLNIDLRESYFVDGNEMALGRIFNNLLSNAIKFTNKSGIIDIGINKDLEGKLSFNVTDNGVGIPEDKIS